MARTHVSITSYVVSVALMITTVIATIKPWAIPAVPDLPGFVIRFIEKGPVSLLRPANHLQINTLCRFTNAVILPDRSLIISYLQIPTRDYM